MFWLAHKNEEDKCKLEDNNDPSGKSIDEEKVDLKQNDTHNYRLYQNASGVVVRLVREHLLTTLACSK